MRFEKESSEAAVEGAVATAKFHRSLERQGVRFHVTGSNDGSLDALRIVPSGLEIDNRAIERAMAGTVSGAETADLNADGSQEIRVYVSSAGRSSYDSRVACSADNVVEYGSRARCREAGETELSSFIAGKGFRRIPAVPIR